MSPVTDASTVAVDSLEPGITQITMSRPERLNALSPELITDMHETLEAARLIAANNEYGVWMTKLGANAALDTPSLRHAMELENRTQILGTFTGNMREASEAFREGREPRWNPL